MLPENEYLILCGAIDYYGEICPVYAINQEQSSNEELPVGYGDLIFETSEEGLVRYLTGITITDPLPIANFESAENIISNGTFGQCIGYVCTSDGELYVLKDDETANLRDITNPAVETDKNIEISLDEVYC